MASRYFKADLARSVGDLTSTLVRMGATCRIDFAGTLWKYERVALRENAIDHTERQPGLGAAGVRITFWREGRGYGYEALEFANQLDNLRAAQRAITLMYQVFEVYRVSRVGVSSFDALFGGFLLLGDGRKEWWAILGVAPDAPKGVVTRAFRRLSRETHPDVPGGSEARFREVKAAYDQAVAIFDRG